MLPKRRKRERSGIQRVPDRHCERHLQWIRGFECAAGDPHACNGKIQAAHVRDGHDGGNAGTGKKPHDRWTIPLCEFHHRMQGGMGERAFQKAYGIDMKKLATEFAMKSPHRHLWEEART